MANKKMLMIRVDDTLHQKAKIQAYKEGKTMQAWITEIIDMKLKDRKSNSFWACQTCGKWNLIGTQLGVVGTCEDCGMHDVPTFPCWERT